jgi:hypothetical protein
MVVTKFIFLLLAILFNMSCKNTPNQTNSPEAFAPIELREDLSESEFKKAIIGQWQSVFEKPGVENVKYLEISENGRVKLIIRQDEVEKNYEGTCQVNFMRPSMEQMVTLAEFMITTPDTNMRLSRINFGLHNALPAGEGPFLRIDEAPFGVLKRVEQVME